MSDKGTDVSLPFHATPSTSPSQNKSHKAMRAELAVVYGEFIGTFMFLFLAFSGTQIALNVAPLPDAAKLIYIAFAFGVALAINVAIFAEISGGMFNPAVTMALWLTRKISWFRAILAIIAQFIAGIAAAGLVAGLLPGPLTVATTLDASCSTVRGLFLEVFLTAQLVLTILTLEGGPAKPAYIGMTLFTAQLCSVFYTGGSLNPARSFGPAVVVGFPEYHWIYWIGPLLGSGLASGVHAAIKLLRLERE